MSLCADCRHLEVWPKVVGGSRYLCEARLFDNHPKEFGRFGYDLVKGTPPVKKCDKYEPGLHYSRKKK
jgi:hypothetical protein